MTVIQYAIGGIGKQAQGIKTPPRKFNNVLELANAVKIDRSVVARTLLLVNLAPDIVTAIFNGTAPDTLTFAKLVTGIPDDWQEQRKQFGMA